MRWIFILKLELETTKIQMNYIDIFIDLLWLSSLSFAI